MPPAVKREACQPHEKCPDLAGKGVFRVGEGGRDEHAAVLQYPADLGKGLLRLRHDVQRIGHDHHIEGFVRIRQAEHILHRKVQLRRAVIPSKAAVISKLSKSQEPLYLICFDPSDHSFITFHCFINCRTISDFLFYFMKSNSLIF